MLFFGLCIFMVSGENVKAAETDPKLGLSECEVAVGSTRYLSVYNLNGRYAVFRSSDTSIASVTNYGRIKGRSCGDAVITVLIVEDGSVVSTLQCDVHIGPAAVSIKFTSNKLVLKEGAARRIYPLVIPKNTVEKPIYWSDDTSIATISSAGTVRGRGVGQTDIYGFLENGESDKCQVTVLSADDYEDYKSGERSLEEILSGNSNSGTQEEKTVEGEQEATEAEKDVETTVTPTPTPASVPATAPAASNVTTPVAGK